MKVPFDFGQMYDDDASGRPLDVSEYVRMHSGRRIPIADVGGLADLYCEGDEPEDDLD